MWPPRSPDRTGGYGVGRTDDGRRTTDSVSGSRFSSTWAAASPWAWAHPCLHLRVRRGDGAVPLCPVPACLLPVSLTCRTWAFLERAPHHAPAYPPQVDEP